MRQYLLHKDGTLWLITRKKDLVKLKKRLEENLSYDLCDYGRIVADHCYRTDQLKYEELKER